MTRRDAVRTMAAAPLAVAGMAKLLHGQAGETMNGETMNGEPAPGGDPRERGSILMLYSTREGQTRRVAETLAAHARQGGHAVELADLESYAPRPGAPRPTAVLVAASIHVGRYGEEVARFVAGQKPLLAEVPSAFLSVCLSQASPAKHAEAAGYIRTLIEQTGWQPTLTHSAAGALRYRRYGFLKRQLMRRIARDGGLPTDTSRDHEFTDWAAVAAFGDAFLGRMAARA